MTCLHQIRHFNHFNSIKISHNNRYTFDTMNVVFIYIKKIRIQYFYDRNFIASPIFHLIQFIYPQTPSIQLFLSHNSHLKLRYQHTYSPNLCQMSIVGGKLENISIDKITRIKPKKIIFILIYYYTLNNN